MSAACGTLIGAVETAPHPPAGQGSEASSAGKPTDPVVGDLVRIRGLTGHVDLNGQYARVHRFDVATKRYYVQLVSDPLYVKRVRLENLTFNPRLCPLKHAVPKSMEPKRLCPKKRRAKRSTRTTSAGTTDDLPSSSLMHLERKSLLKRARPDRGKDSGVVCVEACPSLVVSEPSSLLRSAHRHAAAPKTLAQSARSDAWEEILELAFERPDQQEPVLAIDPDFAGFDVVSTTPSPASPCSSTASSDSTEFFLAKRRRKDQFRSPHCHCAARTIAEAAKRATTRVARPALQDHYEIGAEVIIDGLQSATELNGQRGTVTGFDKEAARFVVNVPVCDELKRVRPGNLRRVLLEVGAQVQIKGLRSDLNGQFANIQGFDPATGRYDVRTIERSETERVRPGNLRRVSFSAAEGGDEVVDKRRWR